MVFMVTSFIKYLLRWILELFPLHKRNRKITKYAQAYIAVRQGDNFGYRQRMGTESTLSTTM